MKVICLLVSFIFSFNTFAFSTSQEGLKKIIQEFKYDITVENADITPRMEVFKKEASEYLTKYPLGQEEILEVMAPMFVGVNVKEVWNYAQSSGISNPLELLKDEHLFRYFGVRGASWEEIDWFQVGSIIFISFMVAGVLVFIVGGITGGLNPKVE